MNLTKTLSLLTLSMALFTACTDDEAANRTGKVKMFITDAPIDDADVTAVVISVTKVEAKGPDGWKTVEEFEEPVAINLLSYQNGAAFSLGEEEVEAGTYSEVRLILDIQQEAEGQRQNPGCFMEYADGTVVPLFVPSGSQSGYKIKGNFEVQEGTENNVTLDFDVRKAVVKAGNSGNYILRPTVRLVSNQEAGTIEGTFDGDTTYHKVVVFAYADGEFEETETNEPVEGEVRFSNAVSSAVVSDGIFTLAFMNSGAYDLYFAGFDKNGNFAKLLGDHQDITVEAGASVALNIETLN